MKIKVTATTSDDVFVVGLGVVEPNTWVEITDKQVQRFKQVNGISLEESDIEVQKSKTTSKKEEE